MSATDAEATTSTDNTATVSDESQAQGTAEPSESTTPTESTEVEKSIPQSQVSKLIAREKRAAAESVRAQYEQRIAEMQNSQSQSQQGINQDPSQIDWDNPNIVRKLDEAIQRKASYERGQQIANDYLSKVTEAKISDPAFGELYDDLGIEQYPVLVEQLSKFDNMTDVIKELGQNPANFANILMLSHLNTANQNDSGRLAAKELNKLSNSIKANNAAKKVQQPAEPLSQMKPSLMSGDGKPTIKDFKKMFKG